MGFQEKRIFVLNEKDFALIEKQILQVRHRDKARIRNLIFHL